MGPKSIVKTGQILFIQAKFDQHLTSMDTVIMNLYKRVFPKWNHEIVPTFEGGLQL